MKTAIASFEFEGNSLSLRVARREDFQRFGLFEGQKMLDAVDGKQLAMSGGVEVLRKAGATLVPVLATRCVPGGHVEDSFYDEIRDMIVEGIAAAMPLDGVFLALHGAMICATEKDPEGAIVAAIRNRIGPDIPIAVSLDLHAHVTPTLTDNAQIVVGYETYPHVDAYRTGACACDLLVRAMKGEIAPVTRIRKYNAIVPVLGGATLGDEPMAQVADHARRIEREGRALSISYFPVQPWLDMADVGITGLAVGDRDAEACETAAQEILDQIWARRRAFELPAMTAEEAVQAAIRRDGRVLIVDAPDSMGAGAAGDVPALLKALVKIAPDVPSAVFVVDPDTVQTAQALGVGNAGDFQVGAKLDPRWHTPAGVHATVERICDGVFTYEGGPAAGARANLGPTAVLKSGGVTILAGSYPFYEHMDEHFRHCGVDIAALKIVSCKNLMNYRKLLDPQTTFIALHGKGAAPLRLQDVEWENRVRPFWPADDMAEPELLT